MRAAISAHLASTGRGFVFSAKSSLRLGLARLDRGYNIGFSKTPTYILIGAGSMRAYGNGKISPIAALIGPRSTRKGGLGGWASSARLILDHIPRRAQLGFGSGALSPRWAGSGLGKCDRDRDPGLASRLFSISGRDGGLFGARLGTSSATCWK